MKMSISFLFGSVDINNINQQELTDVKVIGQKLIKKYKDELKVGDCKK